MNADAELLSDTVRFYLIDPRGPGSIDTPADPPATRPEGHARFCERRRGRKLSESMSRRELGAAAWDREHGERPDPEAFRREILSGLQGVALARIVVRTGCPFGTYGLIHRGGKVPHPTRWVAVLAIASSQT
jgi:hypothetical protein